MSWIEAIVLGLIQGLTEFLPVSSSGHLEIGKAILGVEVQENMTFTVVVHGATVLSTIVVFWRDIRDLLTGTLKFKWNSESKYIVKIIISMIPVLFVGLFFKDEVEGFFDGNLVFVGAMLLLTAVLLSFSHFVKKRENEITFGKAFIIGLAQSIAVLPGISRSGATIATGLLIGIKKENMAKFSFLMVLVPIIGANIMDIMGGDMQSQGASIAPTTLIAGFVAAFVSGWLACKWMVDIVKKGKLLYFAMYCALIGTIAIIFG